MNKTPVSLRNQVMYQVFVRQHTNTHDFKGLINDLDRIKSLGIDIIYLLPFHPIGALDRKGSVGSPYSIKDYYQIDSIHGDLSDFITLCKEVHNRDMKIMMDIVFNHTSRDSTLVHEKRHLFYQKSDGSLTNRIGDWSDIADFNFDHKEVWQILIDVLLYWSRYVDGFRCDVAPLLPLDFWKEARKQVDLLHPQMIWLTESVEYGFIKYLRDSGFDASSDSMMYEVFDICYDYDIYSFMNQFLNKTKPLSRWLEEIYRQEVVYPKNYVKLRAFENHDQERIYSKVESKEQLIHLTAFQFFIKGMPMLYAGQEFLASKRPDLFEMDVIEFNQNNSIEALIKKLSKLKKDVVMSEGAFEMFDYKVPVMLYRFDHKVRLGIFNLDNQKHLEVPIIDGIYVNVLNGNNIEVTAGKISDLSYPIILDTDIVFLVETYEKISF